MKGTLSLKAPMTVRAAEEFSRVRLSQSIFMRDFLFSEIAAVERMSNLPDDPNLAIQAGSGLCKNLLEPLQATFGRLAIRSAYRSPEVNDFGCASNEKNHARHTWDRRDKHDRMGALATVVVPSEGPLLSRSLSGSRRGSPDHRRTRGPNRARTVDQENACSDCPTSLAGLFKKGAARLLLRR
jgi:hypothetical protein